MRSWEMLLNTASVLALVVIKVHLAYGSYGDCSLDEQCTKVQECQEKLTMISQDDPKEIGDLVKRKLCKLTMEGIHVCCPIWYPNDAKDCDIYLDKKYNDQQVYPWLARLLYKSQKNDSVVEFKCSGALISKDYVLTAAHCLTESDWLLTEVWLAGDIKMPGSQIPVEGVINHDFYVEKNHSYDIGLVKLRFPANTRLIPPACLSGRIDRNLEQDKFIVIDFRGRTHNPKFVKMDGFSLVMTGTKLVEVDSGGALLHVHQPQSTSNRTYYLKGVYTGWHHLSKNDYFVNIDIFLEWLKRRVNNHATKVQSI